MPNLNKKNDVFLLVTFLYNLITLTNKISCSSKKYFSVNYNNSDDNNNLSN